MQLVPLPQGRKKSIHSASLFEKDCLGHFCDCRWETHFLLLHVCFAVYLYLISPSPSGHTLLWSPAHAVCVCVCVCVCVLFVPLSTWRLFKARGRKSGVGRLVGACGEISRSKLVLSGGCRRGEDGHSCPGVFSHQEDAAGRPGSEGDAHSQLHAAGRHCWRSFVLGIVVRSRGVLLCLKCVQNVSNREHCSEVGRVILEVN